MMRDCGGECAAAEPPNKIKDTVMTANTGTPPTMGQPDPTLSLYRLLNPQVRANPYPLYERLRTEDPVHWDPFLHAWAVTRYVDVVAVLHDVRFSAHRTPTPE